MEQTMQQEPLPRRTPDEMRPVCGNTIALILAADGDGTDLSLPFGQPETTVEHAAASSPTVLHPLTMHNGAPAIGSVVRTAIRAQVAMMYALVDPAVADMASHAAHSVKRKKADPLLEVLGCDLDLMRERTEQAGNLEVFGVPFSILEIARAFSDDGLQGYEGALVLHAGMVDVMAENLYDLCACSRGQKGVDVVVTPHADAPCPPYLFTRTFLNRLDALADAARHGASSREIESGLAVRFV